MTTLTVGMPGAAAGPGRREASATRATGPDRADVLAEDRSAAVTSSRTAVRSWPLLVLAVPAAAEVWSGWVGIARLTGFGMVAPLAGIWPSLHLDTSITLPVGVEAYAAYALRAWLASEHAVSRRTRRFARWSAMLSFALGMAGQVTYHLLAGAEAVRAPWPITMFVSCLPVLVLAMGTTLAHPFTRVCDDSNARSQTNTERRFKRAFTSCDWLRAAAARGHGSADRWIRACSPATIGFMSSQWRKVAYLAVGGLTEVGFAAGSLLLVVSHQGRGVVDLASGELLARDRQETGAWFGAARRTVLGIGPLDGAWISVCGLAGGQLPGATADGWQARVSGDYVTVSAPGRQPLLVSESEEIRAVGFSPDGTTFIIATSPGLAIYRRGEERQ